VLTLIASFDLADGLLQRTSEGIRAEHADDQGRGGLGERCVRPIDELREIEHDDSFELMLRCAGFGRLLGRPDVLPIGTEMVQALISDPP